jgi:hypothetical protein
MGPSYLIYLITFLAFPLLAMLITRLKWIKISRKKLLVLTGIFLIHNILFLIGISIIGDYPDYIVFSLEYLFFCYLVSRLKRNKFTNLEFAFKILGSLLIGLGFLQGLIGIILFIVFSQDFDSDKIYRFENEKSHYETRRYTYGFATLADTRFTYETYKRFWYLPIEYKIDETVLYSEKNHIYFRDKSFKINVIKIGGKKKICFSSKDVQYLKEI